MATTDDLVTLPPGTTDRDYPQYYWCMSYATFIQLVSALETPSLNQHA